MARREPRRWEADLTAPVGRRNRRSFTYEVYIPDDLAGFDPPLPAAVIARASEAERAVQALNLSPPRLASLETLARRLLRSEAVASSHIEGLRISHRRLARAEIAGDEEHDDTARAVLGNVQAMEAALALGAGERALRLPDLLEIHGLLMRSTSRPGQAGRLRTTQNWIGRNPHSPAGADFVPPPPELVAPLMEDLVRYCNRTDVLPSIQAAVAHAQFETIHPFGDGNGRTGRALIHVLLRRRGLTPRFVPPVSLVLATRSQAYVRGLTSFRDGLVADWLDVFSGALLLATRHAAELADEVERLQARWRAAAGAPRADSAAEALIRLLPSHPLLTARSAEALLGRSFQSANTALAALERAGVVTQVSLGRRNRAFEAKELLQLVNVFERALATPDDADDPARPAPR